MELLHLYELLVEAFDAVEEDDRYGALLKLNMAISFLEPIGNDYSDVRVMRDELIFLAHTFWRWKGCDNYKTMAFRALKTFMDLTEVWIERRAA